MKIFWAELLYCILPYSTVQWEARARHYFLFLQFKVRVCVCAQPSSSQLHEQAVTSLPLVSGRCTALSAALHLHHRHCLYAIPPWLRRCRTADRVLAGGTRKIQRVIGTNSWIGLLASIVLGSQLFISQSLYFVIVVYPLADCLNCDTGDHRHPKQIVPRRTP